MTTNEQHHEACLILYQISLMLLFNHANIDISSNFDALFPEFDYFNTRRQVLGVAAYDTDILTTSHDPTKHADALIRQLFHLGYPDWAAKAQRFLLEHPWTPYPS